MTTLSLLGNSGLIASLAQRDQHPDPVDPSGAAFGQHTAELKDLVQASQSVLPSLGDVGTASNGGPFGHLGTAGLPGALSPSHTHLVPDEEEPTLPKPGELGTALDRLHGLRLPGGEANDNYNADHNERGPPIAGVGYGHGNYIVCCEAPPRIESTGSKWLDKALDWLFGTKTDPKSTPNPDATDTSGRGLKFAPPALGWQTLVHKPLDPGDPVDMDAGGPSNVLRGRDQAVDPNPGADEFADGAARRVLLTSADAVTDPRVDSGSLRMERLPGAR